MLDYVKRFSATEKAVFGVFVIAALVTALIMAGRVNAYFMTEVPAYGGTLHEGLVGLPHTINPVLAVTDVDRDISSLVYSGLISYRDGGEVPDLASDWKISSDGLMYTFNIRPDATFQDGTPVTSADIVFTIEKIQDPSLKSPHIADWVGITATATSPTTVSFNLKQPYSSFLSNTSIGIIPKHIWENVGNDQFIFSEYNIKPIGSGPYIVDGVSRDQGGIPISFRLSAWERYYGEMPHVEDIQFSFFPDEAHALTALENGTIDSLASVSPNEAARLSTNTGEPYKVITSPLTRIFGIFLNQSNNPALAELAVRRALDAAVDRDAIVEAAIGGYGTPLRSPLPPGVIFTTATTTQTVAASKTTTATTTPTLRPSIATAQAILEKDGWKIGDGGIYEKKVGKNPTKTLSLSLYTADVPELKRAAEIVKETWTELGASVDLKIFEPSDLYQNIIRTRLYDALLFGEAVGKDTDLYAFWHSSQRNSPGLNLSMYTNSKTDKILETLRVTTSSTTRALLLGQLDRAINADVPAILLYAPDFVYFVPKTLRNVKLGPVTTATDRWNGSAGWYLETEDVWNIFSKR